MDAEYRVLFAAGDVEGEWWVVLDHHLLAKFATEKEAKVATRKFKIDDAEDWAHWN